MKIDIKINNDTLMAVHNILQKVYAHTYPNVVLEKVHKSIGFELADTFEKKVKNQLKKSNLFDQKKRHSISLKFHEAWSLLEICKNLIGLSENPFHKNQLQALINTLDQKLQ